MNIAKASKSHIAATPDQYTPYFQTSVLWNQIDPNSQHLKDPNENYLGTTYNITSMYAGMFLDQKGNCQLGDATTANGAFNPLTLNAFNWLSQFHGNVSLVIGGDPGGVIYDYLDTCSSIAFPTIVNGLITEFNSNPDQPAKLVGIVFDVENKSFHDGNAWPKISAWIDTLPAGSNMKIIIAIPFNTDYWKDGWSQATMKTFFENYGSKISEVNILDNVSDTASKTTLENDTEGNMKQAYLDLGSMSIPASKISMMLDTDETLLDVTVLKDLTTWLNTTKYNGVLVSPALHLFSRDKDVKSTAPGKGGKGLYDALLSPVSG